MADERARRPVDAVPVDAGPDAAAVARAFDLGEPVGAPRFAARGELGRIWRLDTDRGSWAVKQLLRLPEPAAVAVDVELQQRSIAAGVPAPSPVLTPSGDPVVEVGGTGIRVHTWVDLLPGPVSADAMTAAALLGRLHAAAAPATEPVDPWFCEPVAQGRLPELAAAAVRRGTSWAGLLRARLPDLVAMTVVIEELDRSAATHVCHCDFNPQNVLVLTAGGGVVVDWENAGPYWLHCELASTIAEWEVPAHELPTFLDTYRGHGGSAEILGRASFAGILAVLLHLVEHYADQALDPAAPDEERSRSDFWLDDILRNLVTVEQVDAWTAAC